MDDVQSISLGRAEPQAPVALSGLDKLGERIARRLRMALEGIAGGRPLVTPTPVEAVNFDLWSAMAPTFCALSLYRMHPLKGQMLVKIDAELVHLLVDRFYGGQGGKPGAARTEFTRSEDRLISRLNDAATDALVASWSDLLPLEKSYTGRETDPQALSFADGTEQMLVQSFQIVVGKGQEGTIDLIFPMVALRQIEPLLGSNVPEEGRNADPIWNARLAQQMQNIRLPARTVLARPSLTLAELLALNAGDIIPLNLSRHVPLIVGNRVIAQGSIGEQNGHAALRIEQIN